MIKFMTAAVAAVALVGMPVAASAAQAKNPAASLSVSPTVRAGAATGAKSNKLAGGFSVYTIVLVAALAGLIVVAVSDDNNDNAASR